MNLAQRIRADRESLGWSQEHLASMIREAGGDVGASAVAYWEKGTMPLPINAVALGKVLRWSNKEVSDAISQKIGVKVRMLTSRAA